MPRYIVLDATVLKLSDLILNNLTFDLSITLPFAADVVITWYCTILAGIAQYGQTECSIVNRPIFMGGGGGGKWSGLMHETTAAVAWSKHIPTTAVPVPFPALHSILNSLPSC